MSTILTDDEMPTLPAHPRMLVWPEDQVKLIKAYADAREAAVLAKLAQQAPAGHLRSDPDDGHVFEPRVDGDWSALGKDLYLHPAPQQADRQRVPEGWRETLMAAQKALHRATLPMTNSADMQKIHAALHQANELLAAALEAPQTEQAAVQACSDERPCIPCYTDNGLCADLAAAPEAPAQASAVDERDRKDAERYRWLREQHWTENLIGVVIRPKDNARLGSMLPSLDLLDDTIDHMKARAALAQKGGK